MTTRRYNQRQGSGLRWRYILLDTTPDSASVLASKAVLNDIEFMYQRHHEEGRSMFRVGENNFLLMKTLAEASEIRIKEEW